MTLKNEMIEKLQPTRRAVLQGAAAVTAAAVLAPASTQAQSHDAEGMRYSSDQPIATIHKNVVEIDSGKINGYESGGIHTFKGIPYGDTTGGANRFMPPQKVKPWTGVRPAMHWGWVCPQDITSTRTRRAGWSHDDEAFMWQWSDGEPNEDCLRINVWTPATDAGKRPVMFWIHGGQFINGNSNEMAAYDGENLSRRGDVVVVSINHRLGPLGFLNLSEYGEQYAHSANAGMLDIIAALEWVKTNIGNFGGDAGKVMIFGQSGGAGKTAALLGMPASTGLFHRAAMQSCGTGIHQFDHALSLRTAAAMLKELGIDKANIEKIQEIPHEDILEAGLRVRKLGSAPGSAQRGVGGWGPVVETPDLPRHVWDPAAPESSATVPLLIGTTLNEFGNSVQLGDSSAEAWTMDEVKKQISGQFPGKVDAVVDAISKAHTINKPFDLYSISQGLPRRVDTVTMARLKMEQGKAPVYIYKFLWQSPVVDGRARAPHTIEIPFVFYNSERCASMTGGGAEAMVLSERMSDAWINFARHGDPNHPGLPKWPVYSDATRPTMTFDAHCEVKTNLDDAEIEAARVERRS